MCGRHKLYRWDVDNDLQPNLWPLVLLQGMYLLFLQPPMDAKLYGTWFGTPHIWKYRAYVQFEASLACRQPTAVKLLLDTINTSRHANFLLSEASRADWNASVNLSAPQTTFTRLVWMALDPELQEPESWEDFWLTELRCGPTAGAHYALLHFLHQEHTALFWRSSYYMVHLLFDLIVQTRGSVEAVALSERLLCHSVLGADQKRDLVFAATCYVKDLLGMDSWRLSVLSDLARPWAEVADTGSDIGDEHLQSAKLLFPALLDLHLGLVSIATLSRTLESVPPDTAVQSLVRLCALVGRFCRPNEGGERWEWRKPRATWCVAADFEDAFAWFPACLRAAPVFDLMRNLVV